MKKLGLSNQIEQMSIEKGFERFQEYNLAKNLSDKTLSYYDDCMKYFREFF